MFELTILLFFIIAIIYSICGFGGGSSYIALLYIFSINPLHIPPVALCCNIIVSSLAFYHFWKKGAFKTDYFFPLILASIPSAYFAAKIHIPITLMLSLLSFSLLVAGIRMLTLNTDINKETVTLTKKQKWTFLPIIGLFIGTISGLVGIGGGIFLAPILSLSRWAKPKEIAALCSAFIMVNSISGLTGQIQKLSIQSIPTNYIFFVISVFIGGFIGSRYSANKMTQKRIKTVTAYLIIIVAVRIFIKVSFHA